MSTKVAVFGTLRFPPGQMAALKPHLQLLIDATRAKDGCIAYDVAEDCLDPGLLRFSELWPDYESLKGHFSAPHIEPWRAASKACGLLDRSFAAYDVSGPRAV